MPQHRLLQSIVKAIGSAPLKLCVGFSGGSDSVALLHALRALGHECHAFHCNFHLRGDESNRDEQFCSNFCLRLGIPLHIEHFDVIGRKSATAGESVEMIARDMRYAAFEKYRSDHQLDYIAVAHHREDNIETFFLNLLRSSGVKGLGGMSVYGHNHLLRPMLSAPKQMVMDYIEANNLEYVTDSTNATDDYKRNRIRHHILPMLAREFDGSLDAIARSMAILQAQSATLEADTRRLSDTYMHDDGSIDVSSLAANEAAPTDALYRMVSPLGLSATMVNDILDNADASGRRFGNYELRRGRLSPSALHISPQGIIFEKIIVEHPGQLRCSPNQLIVDASAVDKSSLHIGTPRSGLRFDPYGMNGSKLVSDILREANIPTSSRADYPILYSGDTPIWIVGVRASRHYTISPDASFPCQALKITAQCQ
ncbi:MAG: tRNA lysidine(34) synthetase TilS [Muribaculaceae bacterium]|nr:tRNA lysidine(34) synthetase TilS [Muribaculaceae bacterium]MDE6322090.1 tRNA lysidine(34) synthetase TilS [Muribaculaceae bacterium]